MHSEQKHPIIDVASHTELSTRSHVAIPGMSDQDRLGLLTSPRAIVPPRRITSKPEEDPFDLLTHEDTYGAIAGTIFKECEGIYYQLARFNPDIQKQYAKASKNPAKIAAITMPTVTLGNIYAFNMTKTATNHIEQYTFSRQDEDSPNKGFLVKRDPFGSFVLRRLEDGETNIDDATYYSFLRSAQSWIEDYAAKLNIMPSALLEFAENPPLPRTVKNVALDALVKAFTVEKRRGDGARRPRYLSILLAASLLPVSTHEVSGEVAAVDTWHVVNSIFMSGAHHHAAQKRAAAAKAAAEARNFDAYNLQLPVSATSISVGQSGAVVYNPSLNPAIEKAPAFPSGARQGNVRHLTDVDRVYDNGFDGLTAHSCASAISITLGETAVNIVNVAPGSAGKLSAALSNNQLEVCNASADDLSSADLDGLYIQPK